jgi:enoyl-CoA hydratase
MSVVTLDTVAGVALVSFSTPVLSTEVLDALDRTLDTVASRRSRTPAVLRSLHPSIFLAGAHLAEIAALDADTSAGYAARGRAVLDRLGGMPGPTVAAVHGSCTGGGFDLVLACDRIVAGEFARFSHPGVLRGLVTGWGGTVRLPAAAGRGLTRLALITAAALGRSDLGGRAVAAADATMIEAALAEAQRLAHIHPTRQRLWRELRDRPDLGGRGVTGYNRVSRDADTDALRSASREQPGDGEIP